MTDKKGIIYIRKVIKICLLNRERRKPFVFYFIFDLNLFLINKEKSDNLNRLIVFKIMLKKIYRLCFFFIILMQHTIPIIKAHVDLTIKHKLTLRLVLLIICSPNIYFCIICSTHHVTI